MQYDIDLLNIISIAIEFYNIIVNGVDTYGID
jgi:hypothetical protein